MGKYISTTLIILFLACVGLFGYLYLNSNNTNIQEPNNANLETFLNDVGWNTTETITLLDRTSIKKEEVKGFKVVYAENPQPFLTQIDSSKKVFASVNTELLKNILVFTIHVSPDRHKSEKNKDWFINHQVIRPFNKMLNYGES